MCCDPGASARARACPSPRPIGRKLAGAYEAQYWALAMPLGHCACPWLWLCCLGLGLSCSRPRAHSQHASPAHTPRTLGRCPWPLVHMAGPRSGPCTRAMTRPPGEVRLRMPYLPALSPCSCARVGAGRGQGRSAPQRSCAIAIGSGDTGPARTGCLGFDPTDARAGCFNGGGRTQARPPLKRAGRAAGAIEYKLFQSLLRCYTSAPWPPCALPFLSRLHHRFS